MRSHLVLFLCLSIVACDTAESQSEYDVRLAFPNLTFTRPVDLQHPGDGTNRLFVVEQAGVIHVFENDRDVSDSETFLDIRDRVSDTGNEMGLLGLAFHPDFETNGYFYVNYTAASPRRTVVARYSVDPSDPDLALKDSETVLLEVDQPYSNHNGGQTSFGPDSLLYVSFGDGGSGGDPQGNGQNRATILGSIIRIDVNDTDPGLNYAIPDDNPFAGNTEGYAEEIFAYGLRNPWRFSFDEETGTLWTGDVGQNSFEEIDIIENGENYGWNIMEGFSCFGAASCDQSGLTLPVHDYGRSEGQSVTGGFVYRGTRLPDLVGEYIYGDFESGRIWSLEEAGDDYVNTELLDTSLGIASFGVDANNELYVCAFDGRIHELILSSSTSMGDVVVPPDAAASPNYPNPFQNETMIPFTLQSSADVVLEVQDLFGRTLSTEVLGYFRPGEHTARWSISDATGAGIANGVYLYRLRAGRHILSGTMILVR